MTDLRRDLQRAAGSPDPEPLDFGAVQARAQKLRWRRQLGKTLVTGTAVLTVGMAAFIGLGPAGSSGPAPRDTVAQPGVSVPPGRCEGSGISAQTLGLTATTQDEFARAFAQTFLGRGAEVVTRQGPCAVRLEPSGTSLIFATPGESGEVRLGYASSLPSGEESGLSVSLFDGRLDVYTGATCVGCTQFEARLFSAAGSTKARTAPLSERLSFDSPAEWVDRALVVRLVNDQTGAVGGILLTMMQNGNFAAS